MPETKNLVSLLSLSEELNKKQGNLMKIVKRFNIDYTETKEKNNKGKTVLCRWIRPEDAEIVRNPPRRKYTYWNNEKIDKYLLEHQVGFKRAFDVYTNCEDDSLWWECLVDPSHKWQTAWTNILNAGSACHFCSGRAEWTYDRILETIKEKHHDKELLTTREEFERLPNNTKSPMLWRCLIDGYEWESTWSKINWQETRCHRCTGNERWTTEKVKELVKTDDRFKSIEYVSGEIDGPSKESMLYWRCLNDDCGNIWDTSWYSVHVKNTRCPECSKRGAYGPTLAERHKEEWLKTPLIVYTIKCWNRKETFYKIGLTQKNHTRLRFSDKRSMPYAFCILDEIHTNKYDGSYLEGDLHTKHRKYKYKPQKHFEGWTECFTEVHHIDVASIDMEKIKIYNKEKGEETGDEVIQ